MQWTCELSKRGSGGPRMGPPCEVGYAGSFAASSFAFGRISRAVVHKLVELCLVFGVPQARQEGFKVGLLFFQAAECFCFIGIKGRIARGERPCDGRRGGGFGRKIC